jgi:hypothetical protein
MDAYTCPKGHPSTEPDFCSECGARIQATVVAQPAPAVVEPSPQSCPDCGAARAPDTGIFCEVCGHNFSTGAQGEVPVKASLPQPPAAWTVTVTIDPSLREADSPDPPLAFQPLTIQLDKPTNLIGRMSSSRAIFPEIALDSDDAVSHRHALLERRPDGSLMLRDIGASNGTRLNGHDVQPLVDTPLRDGDQITLGHWTRITIKALTE